MKKQLLQTILLLLPLFAAMLFCSGCALVDPDKSVMAPQKWSVIDRNRGNLRKLRVGMTKDEVRKIMGNPLTDQVYNTENHWFYYTQTKWCDFRTTRDECTPVIFDEEGVLEGWGWEFYRLHYDFAGWSGKAVDRVLE